jgi:hypothetical protein
LRLHCKLVRVHVQQHAHVRTLHLQHRNQHAEAQT